MSPFPSLSSSPAADPPDGAGYMSWYGIGHASSDLAAAAASVRTGSTWEGNDRRLRIFRTREIGENKETWSWTGVILSEVVSMLFYTAIGMGLMYICWKVVRHRHPVSPIIKEIEDGIRTSVAVLIRVRSSFSMAIIIAAVRGLGMSGP